MMLLFAFGFCVLENRNRLTTNERRDGCARAVNENGTLSRITNWDALSEREREVAKRRIAKRNKERLDALKASGEPTDG